MDVSHILNSLNDEQRRAVTSEPGHMLVLAGAGSGKTRVLVHRIAWLMLTEELSPQSILAVTFTNKAAHEMRSRIEELLHISTFGMWVGTFHGLAHRFLRQHYQEAKLPKEFQVLDSDDQLRTIKRIMKALEVDDGRWQPRQVQGYINQKKDEGLRAAHIEPGYDIYTKTMQRLYQAYEETCERAGIVDFAELLLRCLELFRDNPVLLSHYQGRFQHILVDEFQDTNAIQYAWIRLLAGKENHVMIVGDDDQSIYGWRGAKIENIHRFSRDFSDAITIRLEQNYRSTQTILNAANQLISYNQDRLGKELWTEVSGGEPIDLYAAFNEIDEAQFIVARIQQWQRDGGNFNEVAILYRSNAQSRVIEDALIQAGIPYRVFGGLRFFERAEIRDALAYLRLVLHHDDDTGFERVVNLPTRGVGNKTLEALREYARDRNVSLWQASINMVQAGDFTARAARALQVFIDLILTLQDDIIDMDLDEQVGWVITHSGLLDHHKSQKGEKAQARVENLEELITAAKQFEPGEAEQELTALQAFLAHAALEAGEAQAAKHADCVQMMTMHMAKGLEFPLVFIGGLEEGLFPHQMSIAEGNRLEEERRLCYVGMTRAMQRLVLSYAESRMLHGRQTFNPPSRFLDEIPDEFLHEVRARKQKSVQPRFTQQKSSSSQPYQLGARVRHPKFGDGVVVCMEGQGAHARVQVNFDQYGSKWLVLAYAKLEPASMV
jgi:DNA helicase-2/ATP-dependent DNA helicase PcrA